jgi:helicase
LKFQELALPSEFLAFLDESGYKELYPPQEAAVKAGLLEGKSLVISSPTASGKTLTAMMAAYKKVKEGRKVVYLSPLRALASEKYAEFRQLERFGIRCAIGTGDFDASGEVLGKFDILVLTNEKFDSILRHGVSWLRSVGLFISDEVHLAGSGDRGPTLEMILTRVIHLGLDAQLLSLSATISNADEIAKWLRSDLVSLDWRPVPLREGVYDYGRILFSPDGEVQLTKTNEGPALDVALDSIKEGGQSLIFAGTRRRAVSLATKGSELTRRFLTDEERNRCREAARLIRDSGEETGLSKLLAEIVERGSAFHHAGLSYEHRKVVEDYYRTRAIKLLSSTPTLCLPEGEEIFGNPGPVAIQSLSTKDRVLTHKNSFRRVITPMSRPYSGPLVKVTPWFQLPMRMTPEHQVLRVVRTRHSVHSRANSVRSRSTNRHWWTYSVPEWTESKNLRVGDMVLFPVVKETNDIGHIVLPEKGRLANQRGVVGKHWTRLKVDRLTLDLQTLEALGLYIAEGYSGKQGQVMFAINSGETELTAKLVDWLQSLGLRPKAMDSSRHRRVIRACSRQLGDTLRRIFGESAYAKRIPHDLFLLPKDKVTAIIRGMWLGDGNLSRGQYAQARYSTVSSTLAKQLFALLVRIGYMPTIKKARRAGKKPAGTLGITHRHDLYTVSISGKQLHNFCTEVLHREWTGVMGNREFNRGHLDSDYYYMPVRKVEGEEYSGTVYNLEVEEHSSYVGSFVVHNSAGVNLPARRVVIADVSRYDVGSGMNSMISVLEYRQMAGRAGRPQYDDHGETVLVPPSTYSPSELLDHFIKTPPEPIESRLGGERGMRVHLLAAIAGSFGASRKDIDALFSKTLLAAQIGVQRVGKHIDEALGYLLSEQLVVDKRGLFQATGFGKRVSTLYIDPVTGVLFKKSLGYISGAEDTTIALLHLISRSPDFEPKFPLREKNYDQAYEFLEKNRPSVIARLDSKTYLELDDLLQDMRTVMVIDAWIQELREDAILDRLGVEPGDLHRAVDSADWLLYCLAELSRLFDKFELIKEAEFLRKRVMSGIKAELVPLVRLDGIGRVRARSLYSAGFTTLKSIREASVERLAQVEKIGPTTANKIKEQAVR